MKPNPEHDCRTIFDVGVLLQFFFLFTKACEKFKEMVPSNIRNMRMAKEILDLTRNPPHGITCWPKNDRNDNLEAVVQGIKETPYENGSFRIDIVIPERYPMDPPQLKFLTKVYHPNIDNSTGLICLDVLKMPPHGKWRPVNNISLILTAVQQLLSDPNPHDPLDAAIAQEYITNRSLFLENAKKWTQLYAMENCTSRQLKRKSMDESSSTTSSTEEAKQVSTSPVQSKDIKEESPIKDLKTKQSEDPEPEEPDIPTAKRKRNNNDEPICEVLNKESCESTTRQIGTPEKQNGD